MKNDLVIRKIHLDEIKEAHKIASLAFEYPYDESKDLNNYEEIRIEDNPDKIIFEDKINIYPLNRWAAFKNDKEMTGVLAITPYKVHFDGEIYKMGAIGSVCTYPQHRRNGAISKCMVEAVKEMYDEGYEFSYLYAFSEAYYRKFGYEATNGRTRWQFDLKTLPEYNYDGEFVLLNTKDMSDILKVYKKYAASYNMMIDRDSYDWNIFKDYDPYLTNNQIYIYYDSNKNPQGYIMMEGEVNDTHKDLKCHEIVYTSPEVLSAILSFVRVYKNDYKSIILFTHRNVNLESYALDFAQSCSNRQIMQNGMVRVIDVKTVLKNAKYRGSGSLTIKINDNIIEANNGIWYIEYIENKCVNIYKDNSLSPDIIMSIQVFSIAIIGALEVDDFLFRQDVEIINKDTLKSVFYTKSHFILNYF